MLVEYCLGTRLGCLPEETISIALLGAAAALPPAKQKKRARQEFSLRHASEQLGFLHASVITIKDRHYLLAGPSGIGKTVYGQYLVDQYQGQVVVSDWAAVERHNSTFYLSDVNFPEAIKHQEKLPLSGLFFLTAGDDYQRDAFVPNDQELSQLLAETFDGITGDDLLTLQKFWLANQTTLPFCYAVPRHRPEQYIKQTLSNLLERRQQNFSQVGVIGLGSIGTELAAQLGQLSFVEQVHLYNRSPGKTIGYALDLNHGVTDKKGKVYQAHQEPTAVFQQSDVVFLCFRDASPVESKANLPERWQRAAGHVQIMQEYARIISETKFNGTVMVLTNPVDVLSHALYQQSQAYSHALRTYQVYGLGLEVDLARAVYAAREQGLALTEEQIDIYGNHADNWILQTPLAVEDQEKLIAAVKSASAEIRQYVPRTVYGPVAAAIKSLKALHQNGTSSITVMQENSFIGHSIQFQDGLPVFPSDESHSIYESILKENRNSSF